MMTGHRPDVGVGVVSRVERVVAATVATTAVVKVSVVDSSQNRRCQAAALAADGPGRTRRATSSLGSMNPENAGDSFQMNVSSR